MAELVIPNKAMAVVQMAEDALEIAVREHARLVYRISYSVLRDQNEAEDATQETFARVLRYRKKLDEVRDTRSWVARIAWRVANQRRKHPPQVSLEDMAGPVAQLRSSLDSADEILLGNELMALLTRLIASLPDKLRDPLTLSTIQEMPPVEIAQVLGIREAAVRSRLFRARQILKAKLAMLLEGKHGS